MVVSVCVDNLDVVPVVDILAYGLWCTEIKIRPFVKRCNLTGCHKGTVNRSERAGIDLKYLFADSMLVRLA